MPFVARVVKKTLPPMITIRLRAIYKHVFGRYEPEIGLLPALCITGKVGLDVGAALGAYTWPISRYSSGCIAIEPNPTQAKYLQRAFGKTVRVEQCAVSDRAGMAEFIIPLNEDGQADGQGSLEITSVGKAGVAQKLTVECKRIDDLGCENIGFMKIDVEGHEECVLAGAIGVIERDRPNILLESENRHGKDNVSMVRAFFLAHNYAGFFLADRSLHDISTFDPAKHQRQENWAKEHWLMCEPYIYNFIFIPRERLAKTLNALEAMNYRLF